MPKEIIYDKHEHGSDYPEPLPFAVIGWERDGSLVQLGVLQGGDFDEGTQDRPGFYVNLDRNAINRAIRVLRRARDAAYGADA